MMTDLQIAPLKKRVWAFAYDYLVLCGFILMSIVITFGSYLFLGEFTAMGNPVQMDVIAFLTLVLPIIVYFALSESAASQASWGKRKVGLKVINLSGGRLNRSRAFVRSFIKFLPWQIAHTSMFHIPGWPFEVEEFGLFSMMGIVSVYILIAIFLCWMFLSPKNQTFYDWFSGSIIVTS